MASAMGNNPEKGAFSTPFPELSDASIKERSFDLMRLYQISQVRESALPQFDGMGYTLYNQTNEMADISFLPPKKNKGDSRLTSGLTHEKDSSLVSFFLNLNFEGTVTVYHKGAEQTDVGTALTRLVRQSREQEFYDQKRPQFYRNNVAQGTSFALEQYVEMWVPNKIVPNQVDPTALDKVQWVDAGYKKVMGGCQSFLIDGKKVFLEDIHQPDIQKQPGIYIVEYIPREAIEAVWGKSSMWKYVPYNVTSAAQNLGTLANGSIYDDWILGEVDFTKCERIRVYRPFEQRYQEYINGVPMLKPKYPLTAVSPSGLVPIAKGDQDLMNMFAYSKSEPAKLKIDQTILDELLQNMLIKSRQGTFVPRANNSERVLTPDMFLGGRTIANIDPNDIPPLIENPGIQQYDFSFYELFKQHMDEKSISAILEGNDTGGDVTLGQYMDQAKKQAIRIGGKIDGIVNWEIQMLRLRTLNLLAHAYQKDDSGNYRDVPTKGTMFDGSEGLNVVKFDNKSIRSPYDVFAEQKKFKQDTGSSAEFTYLNPDMMRAMLTDPDYYICYDVVPVDKHNDKLAQMMFVSMISQAIGIFGIESMQVDKLKKRYAAKMGEQFDDLFLTPEELQLKQAQAEQAAIASGMGPGSDPSKVNVGGGQNNPMIEKMFA